MIVNVLNIMVWVLSGDGAGHSRKKCVKYLHNTYNTIFIILLFSIVVNVPNNVWHRNKNI